MRFLSKAKKHPGWMAISFQKEGVCVAHIVRPPEQKPVVGLAIFHMVNDPSQRGAVLEKLSKELRLAQYQCSTVLSWDEYQFLSVEAPNVLPEELKTAIRWRLKDMLDYHVDDATIDVLEVPVDKNASARAHSMYAVAARNQTIRDRQALFADAKIPLKAIDIPEMAQRNFSALLEPEGRGLAFLSFDAQGGLLTVTFSGELYLARRIELPLVQLQQFAPGEASAYYDRITLELQRSLDHFDRQFNFISVARLMLASIGDGTAALRDYLAANLYLPVDLFDLQAALDTTGVPELQTDAAQSRYFMTLGAALRHEEIVL